MRILIQFELRKIFSKRLTKIALIAMLLLSLLFAFSTYQNMYAFDGISNVGTGRTAVEIDKSVAQKYAGVLTDDKVRQMMSDFKPVQDLHGMNAKYLYMSAFQSAAFCRFSDMDGNWNGLSVADVYGDEEIRIGYNYGWLKTSQNMEKGFLALSLVIVVMIAPVFSGEYGGVDSIILTSKYGTTKCASAKVIAGNLAALLVTALIAALNFAAAALLSGNSGLDCSILFAPVEFAEGYIPFNITCAALLEYQLLLVFTGALAVTGITLVLSAKCRNQMAALAASAAAFLFPVMIPVSETNPLFRLIALLPVYHVQFVSLMSIEQMSNGLLYAALAVPAALIFMGLGIFMPRRIFAKHQVS